MGSLPQELIDKIIDNPHITVKDSQGRTFALISFHSERDLALRYNYLYYQVGYMR